MKLYDINELCENIDRIASYDITNNKVFGSAYYVYCDGKEIEKYYGKNSLNSNSLVTNDTIYRLASMTKPITAVATLILVERGLLSLDDKVDKFLPEFSRVKIIDENGNVSEPEKIPTIRNILSHCSGIASIAQKTTKMTPADKKSLDANIAFSLKEGLDYEPGTKQIYSGTSAYSVLTKIIELTTGSDYLSFLKKEIFNPCEMPDTTFLPTEEQRNRMIDMSLKRDDKIQVHEMPKGCVFQDFPSTCYLGGAGLVSTLRDYANFAKMLLHKGKTNSTQILKEQTFNQLCTPQLSKAIMPGHTQWGFGVRVITNESYPTLPKGCYGWSGAYGSHFWIDPTNNIVAVFMKNAASDGGAGNESARNFEKAVYYREKEEC